ncbi:transglutaminase-like cysteine peptidase [Brucella pseudogrignonensis]|uniref:Transglutaminase-like cysteine proteinase n=1 Tax=Brucella pseudogrignonensis TaxID=419475 RepID=A0ABU1M3V6_9HYPH|nr:transglutaminase-like cysteine peptidase [Brucella pseudogrignonensis]MDR6430721.1 putative transglutaminase-like cysteine proteinase [Brucella pseudogrignonensis]
MTKQTIIAVLMLMLGTAFAQAANPASKSHWMPTGERTSQPIGHYEFCERHPAECSILNKTSAPLTLNQKVWQGIVTINASINERIAPRTDMEVWGHEEYWEYPTTAGDCDDYMLLKRRELIALGIPANTLLMTVVRQPNGEGHAVLTIRTDRGDFILDNLDQRVRIWNDTDYTYLKRQSTTNTGVWVSIKDGGDTFVSSIRN